MQNHILDDRLDFAFQLAHPAVIAVSASYSCFCFQRVTMPLSYRAISFFTGKRVVFLPQRFADPMTPQVLAGEISGFRAQSKSFSFRHTMTCSYAQLKR